MKITWLLLITLPLLPPTVKAGDMDGPPGKFYSFVGNCDPSKITQSPEMDRLLRAVSLKVGHRLPLNSCYRSQARQDSILQQHNCQPFGPVNCSGRVATRSQHTTGVAADFHSPLDDKRLCEAMNEARQEIRGGKGGVGGYGSGYAHVDIRGYRCQWNICKRYLGPCGADQGYETYVSTNIVDPYIRDRMMQEYRASIGGDDTNPDNVEDFFLLRFFNRLLGSVDDFIRSILSQGNNQ